MKPDQESTAAALPQIIDADNYRIAMSEPGPIRFIVQGGTEILRLCPNGEIYVRGILTTTDLQVVEGLRDWLSAFYHKDTVRASVSE